MAKSIEVIVSPTGEIKVQTRGFGGTSCQDATRLLEAALGTKIQERLTDEFYQPATAQQSLSQRGGA
ncbi:MAG TPA: DUF2997 domain-containing protein [Pirellulaceae bacterium]|nr:DUF2997 domain-containing protein [Pirellulaceae bacterium]